MYLESALTSGDWAVVELQSLATATNGLRYDNRYCWRSRTCIAHDVKPRAYLHRVVHCIVHGWPQAKIRDLLPDRILAQHPELYVGDPDALPMPPATRALVG